MLHLDSAKLLHLQPQIKAGRHALIVHESRQSAALNLSPLSEHDLIDDSEAQKNHKRYLGLTPVSERIQHSFSTLGNPYIWAKEEVKRKVALLKTSPEQTFSWSEAVWKWRCMPITYGTHPVT